MNCNELIAGKTGHGWIVFSDPAGAKACLAFAWMLREQQPAVTFRLISNKHYPFYGDWDLQVEVIADPEDFMIEPIDWVFTGTSHPDSSDGFEVRVIRQAMERGIYVESFIDHWTNLALRFRRDDAFVFPDMIFVIDRQLIPQAIAEGIPANALGQLDNPYLHYIYQYWKSSLSREQFRKLYAIPETVGTVITYAPDPLSLRKETAPPDFDEYTVLRELLQLLDGRDDHFLVVKTHPLQELEQINAIAGEFEPDCVFIDSSNQVANLELMAHSDAIIGFHSNFLLEAHALGKPIFRYFPSENDAFAALFEPVAAHVTSVAALAALLNQ